MLNGAKGGNVREEVSVGFSTDETARWRTC